MRSVNLRFCASVLVLLTGMANASPHDATTKQRMAPSSKQIAARLGSLRLRFEPNQGQADARAKYVARGPGYTLFLTQDEAVLALAKPTQGAAEERRAPGSKPTEIPEFETSVVRMRLVGANQGAELRSAGPQPGTTNYFLGNDRKKWHTGVAGYERVTYSKVYPGIDLVFYGDGQRLEYDFQAAAGADPSRIQLAFEGASRIETDGAGDLLVHSGEATVTVHKPLVYQDAKQSPVAARFVVMAGNRVGFEVGAYDHSKALTIDPVLTYSTYLGGSVFEFPLGIALDAQGDIVIAGMTFSPDFPVLNAHDATLGGNSDFFVTKLDPLGRKLIFSTYIGGSGNEGEALQTNLGNSLAQDSLGNIYVGGYTNSQDFPVVNPIQSQHSGENDGAVFELSPDGQTLLFSTYFGGTANDYVIGIAVNSSGSMIIGGNTDSTDLPLANALYSQAGEAGIYTQSDGVNWSTLNHGLTGTDVWAIAVNPANHSVIYAGANGGGVYKTTDGGLNWSPTNTGINSGFSVRALAIDPVNPNNVYAGTTTAFLKSTNGGASWTQTLARNTRHIVVNPAAPNVVLAAISNGLYRSTDSGNTFTRTLVANVFWVALDPSNSNRVFAATSAGVYRSLDGGVSWVLTGSAINTAQVVTVDPFSPNTLYVSVLGANATPLTPAGFYKSSDGGATFPLHNLVDSNMRDIIASPTTANLLYAPRNGSSIVKSFDGGNTWSFELGQAGFRSMAVVGNPVHDILYAGTNGQDAFMAKINPGGDGLAYSTYLAGNRPDELIAVASDPAGNAVGAGFTSSELNFPIANAFQPSLPGGSSCFVTRLNSAGSTLLFSTYLGGTNVDQCFSAASDASGNTYVSGSALSPDFPLVNAAQSFFGGGCCDLMITKFGPGGNVLYSTLWGGNGDEDGRNLFVDSGGNLYLTGDTGSTNFPVVNALQPTPGFGSPDGGENAIVMKVSPSGQVLFATYLGGSGFDNGNGIVVNSNSDVYVAGMATSQDFPLVSPFQSTDLTGGGGTNFIAKIAFFPPIVTLSSHSLNFGPVGVGVPSAPQSVTLTNTGSGPLLIEAHEPSGPINPGSPFFQTDDCPTVLPAGAHCTGIFTFTPPGVGVFNDTLDIRDDAADSPQLIAMTGTGVPAIPAATVTPPNIDFGNVGVNFTSGPQTVTITSTGTAPLQINGYNTGEDPQFAVSGSDCPSTLAPGLSCHVFVTVTPLVTGPISGTLFVFDNAADSPQTVGLSANGTQTITVTQPLSPTEPNNFTFPGKTFNYSIQFPPGTDFSGVTASVTAAFSTGTELHERLGGTFPGAQCIVYDGSGGNCTVFQVKCTPSPCPSSGQPITLKTAFDSSQPITNPGFLQAETGTNDWHNIFTDFYLPKIDGTVKGGSTQFSDFVAVVLGPAPGVSAGVFGGFQSPLAPKNTRVFTAGDTIPVKFFVPKLGGPSTAFVTNATAKLTLVKGTTPEPVKLANTHGTPPNIFKYNPTLRMYEFYLDTTGLPKGQYQMTVSSDSFPAQQVTFTLR